MATTAALIDIVGGVVAVPRNHAGKLPFKFERY